MPLSADSICCSSKMIYFICMVHQITEYVNCLSTSFTTRNALPSISTRQRTQTAEISKTDRMPFIRKFFSSRGFQEDSVEVMCASWQKSTIKQYEVYLKKWANFCEGRNIDPMQLREKSVVLFLTDLFYKIESYSTLNLPRSALSTILCNDNGLTIVNLIPLKG